jgi:hypothetical protein
MQSILRSRISALFTPERHQVWQLMFAGCAAFWILLIVAVMGIR